MDDEKNIKTHVIAVMGFVKKGDKFLIAKRALDDPQAGGQWSIPGGKVDPGVSTSILEDTMQREIEEEVGVKVGDDMHLVANDSFYRVSGHHVIAITFLCIWKSGRARLLEDQEEVRWLTLGELQKFTEMPDHMEKAIKDLAEYLRKHKAG